MRRLEVLLRQRRPYHRMSWLSKFRSGSLSRAAVAVACWALLLQVLVPLVPMQSARAAASDVPAWALASICHVAATPAAAADDNPADPAKPAPTGRGQLCPVCVGLHIAGTFVPPSPVAVPAPTQILAADFAAGAHTAPHPSDRAPVQARAPPAID